MRNVTILAMDTGISVSQWLSEPDDYLDIAIDLMMEREEKGG